MLAPWDALQPNRVHARLEHGAATPARGHLTNDRYVGKLVVVAPDGTLAAYCICWFDAVNRSGEFEPVGTSTAFRGQGLGKGVMAEGLRRLRQQGARVAYVTALGDNHAAQKLYEAIGFTTYTREYAY